MIRSAMRRKRTVAAMALAMLAAPVLADPPPQTIVEPWRTGRGAPRGEGVLREAMLAGHNRARAAVGAPPLVWDGALAQEASRYARQLADIGRFEHATDLHIGPHRGENLWEGTRGAYAYGEMVAGWIGEKRRYKPGVMPDISTSGSWHDVGHYSQIIWRTTTAFGCAMASNAEVDILVCRYTPPGNIIGRRADDGAG
jgi:hypothetical protein